MKRMLLALQFLTILPAGRRMTADEDDISGSTSYFVIAGLVQGILLVAADYVSGLAFHPDLVTALILLVYILSNGGFHLDGLADTFDAVAAKPEDDPERDRRKRLAIMKESSTGPIGVIAIVSALGLKYLAIKNISHMLVFNYYSALILMPVISKWVMVVSMYHGKPARNEGLGSVFIKNIRFRNLAASTLLLLLILGLLSTAFVRYMPVTGIYFYAAFLALLYILCILFDRFSEKRFGGLTGDLLGAAGELTEIIFLMAVILWSRLSI